MRYMQSNIHGNGKRCHFLERKIGEILFLHLAIFLGSGGDIFDDIHVCIHLLETRIHAILVVVFCIIARRISTVCHCGSQE